MLNQELYCRQPFSDRAMTAVGRVALEVFCSPGEWLQGDEDVVEFVPLHVSECVLLDLVSKLKAEGLEPSTYF